MAIKGLSYVPAGAYSYSQGAVTYSSGVVLGHAIEYSISIDTQDANPLYGDNMIVETDGNSFASGTLSINTSELTEESGAWLMGQTAVKRTIGSGGSSVEVDEYVFDDNLAPKEIGIGVIELHQIDQGDYYKAVVLPRVRPNIPSNAARTKGATIEWQTPTIEMQILRSEQNGTGYVHPWKIEAWFDTEEEAKAYLNAVLNVAAS